MMNLETSVASDVVIVGAGLAGSEAAWFLANKGLKVVLVESKKIKKTPAQKLETAAELVCTNSLKSLEKDTPHGMLKCEMRLLNSLVMEVADECAVPAGGALAVDRELFSQKIQKRLETHKNITFLSEEVENPLLLLERHKASFVIVASGPLTLPSLESWILKNVVEDERDFYFYDAIAPIVDADSIDMTKCYFKDRYKDEGDFNYLNAPMTEEEYKLFIEELKTAEKVLPKNFEEERFFESCLPIDVMAQRGEETARFSCMKPKGLRPSPEEKEPYAVVQMRKENLLGNAYNLVGFQTRLTYPEQKRVFRLIPGLEKAEFIHYGSVHRNSFLNAKSLLNFDMSLKKEPRLFFAGQMTGVEGYTESAMSGLYVAWQIYEQYFNKDFLCQNSQKRESTLWPKETAMGALVHYLMTAEKPMPMNINMGILPVIEISKEVRKQYKKDSERKKLKKKMAQERGEAALRSFLLMNSNFEKENTNNV